VGILVVDADPFALDVLVDDGQHGALLPRQTDGLVDLVAEEVPQLTRRRRALHSLVEVHLLVHLAAQLFGVSRLVRGRSASKSTIATETAISHLRTTGRGRGPGRS